MARYALEAMLAQGALSEFMRNTHLNNRASDQGAEARLQ
jgi:hypothetical protein